MVGSPLDESEPDIGRLAAMLQAARGGTDSDVGRLFESTRRYLLLVANRSLDSQLHQKVAASDLVQETFVDAHRDFAQFVGKSEGELFAWLRQILLHKAAHARDRYHGTAKRDLAKERPLSGPGNLVCQEPSPSALAMGNESNSQLAMALERLPVGYRQVIELRSFERLPFAEVGLRMGRSEDAAGKLWCRAIDKLREQMVNLDESGQFSLK